MAIGILNKVRGINPLPRILLQRQMFPPLTHHGRVAEVLHGKMGQNVKKGFVVQLSKQGLLVVGISPQPPDPSPGSITSGAGFSDRDAAAVARRGRISQRRL